MVVVRTVCHWILTNETIPQCSCVTHCSWSSHFSGAGSNCVFKEQMTASPLKSAVCTYVRMYMYVRMYVLHAYICTCTVRGEYRLLFQCNHMIL